MKIPRDNVPAHKRHGIIHQPFHCGVAQWPVVGDRQRWTRCNVSFHFADRSRNPAGARNWNVIRYPGGCLAVMQIEPRPADRKKR